MKSTGLDGSSELTTMSISRTIEIIVYEEGATFPSLTVETTIEESKNVYKTKRKQEDIMKTITSITLIALLLIKSLNLKLEISSCDNLI